MKAIKFLCPLIIYTSPLSAAKKYSRGKYFLAANCRMKRSHWQLFALSTMSFSVSTENLGFTVSTPFFFLKNVFLNFKMSKVYVNHSRVAVDLERILQCGSADSKTAKLVDDIGSEYFVELKSLQNHEYLAFLTRG